MTDYLKPRFSVSQSGRSPEDCTHGWIVKGRCWYCGTDGMVPYSEGPANNIVERMALCAAINDALDVSTTPELREVLDHLRNPSTPSPPEPSE